MIWNFPQIIITYLSRYIFNFAILLSHIFDLIIHDNVIEGSLNFQQPGTGFIDRFSIELLLLLNFYLRKIFDTTRVYDYRFPPPGRNEMKIFEGIEPAFAPVWNRDCWKIQQYYGGFKIILNSILYSKSINFYKYANRSPFYMRRLSNWRVHILLKKLYIR